MKKIVLFLLLSVILICSCRQRNISKVHRAKQEAKSLDKVIKSDTNNIEAYVLRASARYISKDFQGAIADYTWVIERKPDSAIYYTKRAMVKMFSPSQNYQGAIIDFTKAIEIKPNDTTNYYYRALCKRIKDIEGACIDYEKAMALGSITAKFEVETFCKKHCQKRK
jgi:tetratricopeptide (TPR) repeat protein